MAHQSIRDVSLGPKLIAIKQSLAHSEIQGPDDYSNTTVLKLHTTSRSLLPRTPPKYTLIGAHEVRSSPCK